MFFLVLQSAPVYNETDICATSPCGANAECNNGVCHCISEYFGDPYVGCRPECVTSSDCPRDKACLRNKCIDPCPGTCGQNAKCEVFNHIPNCVCPQFTTGNPFFSCTPVIQGLYHFSFWFKGN